jgi:hypothetical protein
MKKLMLCLLLATLSLSAFATATEEKPHYIEFEKLIAPYGQIDVRGLKALIDSHLPFLLLDARGNKWHDGNIIPGALLASYEDSSEELEMIAPNKDCLIVVYCFSATCPLGPRLALKLVEMGYPNVLEFSPGLKEWRDVALYPVDTIRP